jgi:hypothetical protein
MTDVIYLLSDIMRLIGSEEVYVLIIVGVEIVYHNPNKIPENTQLHFGTFKFVCP